jgi:hypothetical protein
MVRRNEVTFEPAGFAKAVERLVKKGHKVIDPKISKKSILLVAKQVSRLEKAQLLFDSLAISTYQAPYAAGTAAMLVCALALREVMPFEKARTLDEDDLDDYGGDHYGVRPKVFFHHGDVRIKKPLRCMVQIVVTGDLVAERALVDNGTSPGGCWVVGGKLVARDLSVAGRLIVGGDVTIQGSLVANRGRDKDRPPRPIAIGGSLTAAAMGLEHHELRVGGKTKVRRIVELPAEGHLLHPDVAKEGWFIASSNLREQILKGKPWFQEEASAGTPAPSRRPRR